jgi:hypothetical protein
MRKVRKAKLPASISATVEAEILSFQANRKEFSQQNRSVNSLRTIVRGVLDPLLAKGQYKEMLELVMNDEAFLRIFPRSQYPGNLIHQVIKETRDDLEGPREAYLKQIKAKILSGEIKNHFNPKLGSETVFQLNMLEQVALNARLLGLTPVHFSIIEAFINLRKYNINVTLRRLAERYTFREFVGIQDREKRFQRNRNKMERVLLREIAPLLHGIVDMHSVCCTPLSRPLIKYCEQF